MSNNAVIKAFYNGITVSDVTWDPGTVLSGQFTASSNISFYGVTVGQVISLGISPAPPDGVVITAIPVSNGYAHINVYNFSGSSYAPGTLTIKYNMTLLPSTAGSIAGGDLSGNYPNPNVIKINGNAVSSQSLGAAQDGYILTFTNSDGYSKFKPISISAVNTSGDLSGSSASQTVISISGSSPIAITPSTLQWLNSTSTPILNQANKTTTSGTGEALTIQAQNETGSTSTGGSLNLTSGTGTLLDGYVNLQSGGVTVARITSNKLVSSLGRRIKITTISNTYQVLETDDVIIVTANTSGFTITLPASPVQGDIYEIKDAVGNAETNPLIISGNGNNIDGETSFTLNINYAALLLAYNGTSWSIL